MSTPFPLRPEHVHLRLAASGKPDLLRKLAHIAAPLCGLDEATIEASLVAREALGSTGVGRGVALPHAEFASLDSCVVVLCTLARSIAFEAIDDQPIDVVACILRPAGSETGRNTLSLVARALREPKMLDRLRGEQTASAVCGMFNADAGV